MKRQISITLDKELIISLDKKRGLVALSVFINEILKNWEKKENARNKN